MKLRLGCVLAEADSYGKVKREQKENIGALAGMMDGMEIEGVLFHAWVKGNAVEIVMDGEGLSGEIRPNYTGRIGASVCQIGFRKVSGKRTANVLDMFLRKVNKMLLKTGQGCNVLLVKDAEVLDD
jgi:hypothetical protein